jgi:hypothetical protein
MIGYTVSALQITANGSTAFLLAQALNDFKQKITHLGDVPGSDQEHHSGA